MRNREIKNVLMFPKKMKQAEERLANQLQKQANSNKENIK
jgi:hypothetical protein